MANNENEPISLHYEAAQVASNSIENDSITQISNQTNADKQSNDNDRTVAIVALFFVLGLTVYFIYRFIIRILDEAKRWVKFLVLITATTLLVSIYYAPTETAYFIKSSINVFLNIFKAIGAFIMLIIENSA